MSAHQLSAATGVILAALVGKDSSAAGIAAALEAAGVLQSPESAAELDRLRGEVNAAIEWIDANTPQPALTPGAIVRVMTGLLRDERALRARVAELEAQRAALTVRLRTGQRWQQGRSPALVSEDFVSQPELRNIFDIKLTAPWDAPAEDPCRPCGCPKRFERHADGCPTECPSCAAPADLTGYRIPEHRDGCPQAVTA